MKRSLAVFIIIALAFVASFSVAMAAVSSLSVTETNTDVHGVVTPDSEIKGVNWSLDGDLVFADRDAPFEHTVAKADLKPGTYLLEALVGLSGGGKESHSHEFTVAEPVTSYFSGDVFLAGEHLVPAGEVHDFDPNISTTVHISKNFIVEGTLQMRPANEAVKHRLIFEDVDESAFVGEGMDPVASDVGLWVMNAGKLDIAGTPRARWNHTGDDPTWLATDELVRAPYLRDDYTSFVPWTKGDAPPSYKNAPPAEVINLTSNVSIEGTPTGRTHVFIRNTSPVAHTLDHLLLRHMGPRKNDLRIIGRWPLHFHHSGTNNAGTVVRGVVVREAGSHAFVPHVSDGISFIDTVAYDVQETPYWWDTGDASNATLWEHAGAFKITKPSVVKDPEEPSLWGFAFRKGVDNVARDLAVAGIDTRAPLSAGFDWPAAADNGPEPWLFDGGVAHNVSDKGSFSWFVEDKSMRHTPIHDMTIYNCRKDCVEAGSYGNSAQYRNLKVIGGENPVALVAKSLTSHPDIPQAFYDPVIDADGVNHALVLRSRPVNSGPHPVLVLRGQFSGHTAQAIGTTAQNGNAWVVDFVETTTNGRDLEPSDFVFPVGNPTKDPQPTRIRVQQRDGSAYEMDYQGNVTTIPTFYPYEG